MKGNKEIRTRDRKKKGHKEKQKKQAATVAQETFVRRTEQTETKNDRTERREDKKEENPNKQAK